jgi:hypothetical protein
MTPSEPDLKQAVRTVFADIVDEAPMAPEWYDMTTGTQRLASPARSRRQLTGPAIALAAAMAVTFVIGGAAFLFRDDITTLDTADTAPTVTTTAPPPTTMVPDQPPLTTTVPLPAVVVVESWTIDDAQALLSDSEWDRVRAEAELSDEYSEFWDGPAWSARDLKWHEDGLSGTGLFGSAMERGGQLPIFGSALLDGGTINPESIITNGRPLFVLVWRPSTWLVAGPEVTTVLNLDAFQQAYERWGDQIDFVGVIWNEPWEAAAAPDEHSPTDIVDYGRLVVSEHGYTFPNVIGRIDLPQVLEWAPMWLLTDADGRVTGGFFAHGAIRDADTALDSLPVDHLLSRLVIPIDDLVETLNEQYLWAPENEGGEPREEPLP